jgi:3-isopropylmalate/(R)-2-methylmalate dehydratase large subunit
MTMNAPKAKTLFEKIWESHVVAQEPGAPALLYIDLHLVHEVTSPQAFAGLRARGLRVRRPARTFATVDHSIPTGDPAVPLSDMLASRQIAQMEENARWGGIRFFGMNSTQRGIVHVIGPELGLTQPGMTVVCGDSHTSTHGAFGALAFGIGTSEVEHVLASQCLLQRRPGVCEVRIEGKRGPGVTAGSAVGSLTMEERMTICNMSIEGGARAGMMAPDDTTIEYLAGREFSPRGAAWESAVARWRKLPTDDGAVFDRSMTLDISDLSPMITFGTNPGMGLAIGGPVPSPDQVADPAQRSALRKALEYMNLTPGQPLLGSPVNVVFIGSCTNGRISDLRLAASVLRGRRVAPTVRLLVVPGSQAVKAQAEDEGLDRIFKSAGAEWREAGCSMCIAMNGDQLSPGQYAVSTSNRNFEGRQGKGGRTFLASPLTAAACAVTGTITDVRTLSS